MIVNFDNEKCCYSKLECEKPHHAGSTISTKKCTIRVGGVHHVTQTDFTLGIAPSLAKTNDVLTIIIRCCSA